MNLRFFVNSPEAFTEFQRFLEGKIASSMRTLEQSTDPVAIYRLQGQIFAYRRMFSMRDEVNSEGG